MTSCDKQRQAPTLSTRLTPVLPPRLRWCGGIEFSQGLGRGQSQSQNEPETPRPGPSRLDSHRHNYVNATFSQRGFIWYPVPNTSLLNMRHLAVSCRVCAETLKKGAVICCRCCLVAHSKCAALAPPGCPPGSRNRSHQPIPIDAP